jgi:hypothetical protein
MGVTPDKDGDLQHSDVVTRSIETAWHEAAWRPAKVEDQLKQLRLCRLSSMTLTLSGSFSDATLSHDEAPIRT